MPDFAAPRSEFRGVRKVTLLSKRHLRSIGPAGRFDKDEWCAGLLGKAGHNLIDRFAGSGRDLIPENFSGGIPVGVFLKIGIHGFAENFGTNIRFHHAQHRCGLAVGDAVEERLNLGQSLRLGAHGAYGGWQV